MASFVLVHGAAHGAWCWERLIPILLASPQVEEVVAIDLVGHGTRIEEKPLKAICLGDYADEIVSLDAGHSAFASRPQELADLLIRVSRL